MSLKYWPVRPPQDFTNLIIELYQWSMTREVNGLDASALKTAIGYLIEAKELNLAVAEYQRDNK